MAEAEVDKWHCRANALHHAMELVKLNKGRLERVYSGDVLLVARVFEDYLSGEDGAPDEVIVTGIGRDDPLFRDPPKPPFRGVPGDNPDQDGE